MGDKRQLLQVKIFKYEDHTDHGSLERVVNECIIDWFKSEGNYPKVETNSKFVTVKGCKSINL